MIATRQLQRHFADGFIAEAVAGSVGAMDATRRCSFEDDTLLLVVQQELAKRFARRAKTRGRKGTSADVVLRMLLLKHVRDWSFEVLTREVRANLVYPRGYHPGRRRKGPG